MTIIIKMGIGNIVHIPNWITFVQFSFIIDNSNFYGIVRG